MRYQIEPLNKFKLPPHTQLFATTFPVAGLPNYTNFVSSLDVNYKATKCCNYTPSKEEKALADVSNREELGGILVLRWKC